LGDYTVLDETMGNEPLRGSNMAAPSAPSFGRLVFGRALSETWHLFNSKLKDALYVVLSIIVGFPLYALFWGLPNGMPRAMTDVIPIVMFSFVPLGIFVACVFLWNLWLAPIALAYEATKENSLSDSPLLLAKKVVRPNWAIWKHMQEYSVRQFAAILANNDPMSAMVTSELATFQQLILEEIETEKLAYIPEYQTNPHSGTRHVKPIDERTKIRKEAAIQWAESKSFNVAHIK
jgi:hypothetical protein